MDSRQEQLEIVIRNLAGYLGTWGKEAPSLISFPDKLQKEVSDLLSPFDKKQNQSPVRHLTQCNVEKAVCTDLQRS